MYYWLYNQVFRRMRYQKPDQQLSYNLGEAKIPKYLISECLHFTSNFILTDQKNVNKMLHETCSSYLQQCLLLLVILLPGKYQWLLCQSKNNNFPINICRNHRFHPGVGPQNSRLRRSGLDGEAGVRLWPRVWRLVQVWARKSSRNTIRLVYSCSFQLEVVQGRRRVLQLHPTFVR